MMPASTFSEHWHDLRSKIRPHWMALSDADVAMIDGKLDVLIELLREKYGFTQLQAESEVNRFMDELGLVKAAQDIRGGK